MQKYGKKKSNCLQVQLLPFVQYKFCHIQEVLQGIKNWVNKKSQNCHKNVLTCLAFPYTCCAITEFFLH